MGEIVFFICCLNCSLHSQALLACWRSRLRDILVLRHSIFVSSHSSSWLYNLNAWLAALLAAAHWYQPKPGSSLNSSLMSTSNSPKSATGAKSNSALNSPGW